MRGLERIADDLALVGREVIRRGLTWGASGNLSVRLGEDRFLVTAHRARLDALGPGTLATCRIDSDDCEGPARPSVESEMHRAVYAAVPAAHAVLHTSAPYTTLVACTRLRLPVSMSTDGIIYVGRVLRVPFRHPGTRDLARAAAEQARKARTLLLSNHGSLVWGSTLDEVLSRTEALEFMARLVVTARAAGVPFVYLPDEVVGRYANRHSPG